MGLFSRNKNKSTGVCFACGSPIIDDMSRARVFIDSDGKNFELKYHYFPPCSISKKNPDNCEYVGSSTIVGLSDPNAIVKSVKIDEELGIINKWKDETFSLLKQEKFEEALTNYNEILKINPLDVWLLGNKGYALLKLKKYEDAINCFDKASGIEPDNIAVLCNKGIALKELKKYEDAINCFDKVLQIEPENEIALDNKQYSLEHNKNISKYQHEEIETDIKKKDSFKPSATLFYDDEN